MTMTSTVKPYLWDCTGKLHSTHEIPTIWLPKQDWHNDNISWNTNIKRKKFHKAPFIDEYNTAVGVFSEDEPHAISP